MPMLKSCTDAISSLRLGARNVSRPFFSRLSSFLPLISKSSCHCSDELALASANLIFRLGNSTLVAGALGDHVSDRRAAFDGAQVAHRAAVDAQQKIGSRGQGARCGFDDSRRCAHCAGQEQAESGVSVPDVRSHVCSLPIHGMGGGPSTLSSIAMPIANPCDVDHSARARPVHGMLRTAFRRRVDAPCSITDCQHAGPA